MKISEQNNQATNRTIIVPTEDQWFEVNPQAIDQTIFAETRKDWRQEETRVLIVEAFEQMKIKTDKYGAKYKTMFPHKNWTYKTSGEIKKMACKFGGHTADWVEQALEWAQRICNGESWEDIANKADISEWFRAIIWKDGKIRLVGGSAKYTKYCSTTSIHRDSYNDSYIIYNAVPLVACYN